MASNSSPKSLDAPCMCSFSLLMSLREYLYLHDEQGMKGVFSPISSSYMSSIQGNKLVRNAVCSFEARFLRIDMKYEFFTLWNKSVTT
jgi:hypothetical protein